jgi:hypothetical protein
VTSSRALSLLAHGASAVFLVAEVTAWLTGLWPATPLTFAAALAVVATGPLVGMLHVATAAEEREPATTPLPAPPRTRRVPEPAPAVAPRLAAARRFHAWRDGHHSRA